MRHDSFIQDMTHSYEIYTIHDIIYLYETWLIHMRHDSFIRDMTHSYEIWYTRYMTSFTLTICPDVEMDGSCQIWMGHITYEWGMTHVNESCHMGLSRVTWEWVMPHVNESCHMWMNVNESCHMWMSDITHRNESCHIEPQRSIPRWDGGVISHANGSWHI